MENRGPRVLQTLEIGGLKTIRFRLPLRQLPVVQRQKAKHIDDGGALDQVDGEGGIFFAALGEKLEAASVEERSAEGQKNGPTGKHKRILYQTWARQFWLRAPP